MSSSTTINPQIFRAYDIRGLAEKELKDAAEVIGKAIGTYFIRTGARKIAVGRDNRESSEDLKNRLVRGLTAAGCDVVDIGLSTSPLLYFTVIDRELGGGVNVTGSHLPPINNGFKIVGRDAYPVATEGIETIRDIALSGDFESGQGSTSEYDPKPGYLERVNKPFKLARKLKVVVDTGNGVAGLLAPQVIENLGCEVIALYRDLDATFPHHLPNPEKDENVKDLRVKVLEVHADVGLAFDGDGDRLGVLDEKGIHRAMDFITILLARDYLTRHPGERVLFDVKSSQNVIDDIKAHGGVPVMYKTGHSLIKQKMRDDNIELGAEYSGHIFDFEDYLPFDDASFAGSRVLSILAAQDIPLSAHWATLPTLYASSLIEVHCADEAKFDVIEKIVATTSARYEVNTIDGARVAFEHGWAVVRASNTSPNLTIRFEADSPANLLEIANRIRSILSQFPSVNLVALDNEINRLRAGKR